MKIIVGLGNPGEKYQNTYHNMGYKAVSELACRLGKKIDKKDCSSVVTVFSKNNEKIVLALPETYMNLSGEAVNSLLKKYDASVEDLVVVYDDIDLPAGSLRLRKSGSAGTHNGMRNILKMINNSNFKRIRVGIGDKPEFMDMADYVLSSPVKEKKELIDSAISDAASCLEELIKGENFDNLMQKYNKKAK